MWRARPLGGARRWWVVEEFEVREGEQPDRVLRIVASSIASEETARLIAALPRMVCGLLDDFEAGVATETARCAVYDIEEANRGE